MIIVPWETLAPGSPGSTARAPVALTIGVFDGVHIGHQRLLAEVVHNNVAALPLVCSFRRNPGEVLGTRPLPGSILSNRQKMLKFERLGILQLVLIDFSPEIGKLQAEEFLAVLERFFDLRKLVIGYNFRMGRGRTTGIQELVSRFSPSETELTVIPAAHYQDRVVSSSRIREAILQARFEETSQMLNEPYCLDLVGTGRQRSGPRTELARKEISQVLPREGTYGALLRSSTGETPIEVTIDGERVVWQAAPDVNGTEICFVGGKDVFHQGK
jgi:riboflavin kinase/FMN adenylyltransferase